MFLIKRSLLILLILLSFTVQPFGNTEVYAGFADDLVQDIDDFLNEDEPKLPFCTTPANCDVRSGLDESKNRLGANFSTSESIIELLIGWTNWILGFLFFLAMTALIVAGFFWITDFGGDSGQQRAIKIIQYVAIGIVIILIAYPIVLTVLRATS